MNDAANEARNAIRRSIRCWAAAEEDIPTSRSPTTGRHGTVAIVLPLTGG